MLRKTDRSSASGEQGKGGRGEMNPIVAMKLGVKESSQNRSKRQLFPTPGEPA